jgi:hypothetical protein
MRWSMKLRAAWRTRAVLRADASCESCRRLMIPISITAVTRRSSTAPLFAILLIALLVRVVPVKWTRHRGGLTCPGFYSTEASTENKNRDKAVSVDTPPRALRHIQLLLLNDVYAHTSQEIRSVCRARESRGWCWLKVGIGIHIALLHRRCTCLRRRGRVE